MKSNRLSVLLVVGGVGGLALAQPVTLNVSAPTHVAPGQQVQVDIQGPPVGVSIAPGTTAAAKAMLIAQRLSAMGWPSQQFPPASSSLRMFTVPSTASVTVGTGGTAEAQDTLSTIGAKRGRIAMQGLFSPFNAQNAVPARFTAGIVTDLGTAIEQVSAQELNFQTDGPIICQALFQRLAPRAPQYGAQINYAGDRLEVYFDPAYTVTQGGVIFGTNSPTPGCSGTIEQPGTTGVLKIVESPSHNPFGGSQRLTLGTEEFVIPVPPLASASIKADCIAGGCAPGSGVTTHPVFHAAGSDTVKIVDLAPGTPIRFDCHTGADMPVQISFSVVTIGQIGFADSFDPIGGTGQPARFAAGIVTDLGTAVEQVSAQELNFQTDGPIICQALFQRLAPRAPQYGAQINYAGDRLEVYFDPAYTVTQGGVVVGTTSLSPGAYATLNIPPVPPCDPDYNADGNVDQDDVVYLITVIAGGPNPTGRDPDFNGDGNASQDDVVALIGVVAGAPCP
jgi:hypothetical protein